MISGLNSPPLLNNTIDLMYNRIMSRPAVYTAEERKQRQAQNVANWRAKYPEKQKLARQRAYDNRKLKAILMVGEAKCIRCGCDQLHALEFNHKNGDGSKEFRTSNNVPMMDRILTFKRGVEDLEILCRVCNALDFIERKIPETKGKFTVVWHE